MGETAYVMEIDARHPSLGRVFMWCLNDIRRICKEELGLGDQIGGNRDSEWVVLYKIPAKAICREYKSTKTIRSGEFIFILMYLALSPLKDCYCSVIAAVERPMDVGM